MYSEVFVSAFLDDHQPDMLEHERMLFEPERALGVYDGDTMIGTGEILTLRMTLPGTGPAPIAGVTTIAVAPGHRRRGVLTMIMREQLTSLHDVGEPIAGLWASEGGIYGRFGYGIASQYVRANVPRGAAFRPDVAVSPDRVRELPREQAIPLVREIYDKVYPARVGHLERADRNWEFRLFDAQYRRHGQGAFRFAVHPEGYAIYRAKPDWQDRGPRGTLSVYEQFATNPQAYAAIGRYLLDMDMVGEVNLNLAVDDPIPHMLADPRSALRTTFDSLWVRLVDVDRALQVRRYSGPLELTLEVADEFCPWNAGRWRLSVAEDGTARVERTDAAPDLALHAVDLGAAFLGGTRLTALAAAGRVRELTSGALARATVAFLHDHEPACLEIF